MGSTKRAVLPGVRRIVVMGDIHGDLKSYSSSLLAAGLVDDYGNWIGGSTNLVQVGDIIDRKDRVGGGSDEQSESAILSHLFDLQDKAELAGGAVHIILGNHEIMNVMGDFSYVSPMGMSDFGGNRAEAFAPSGSVSKVLAERAVSVLKLGSWLFSHAGVKANVGSMSLGGINNHVREYLLGKSKGLHRDVINMFFHRDFAGPGGCDLVKESLSKWGAKGMVVGHTVQVAGIKRDCLDSLWWVDVGLSSAFGYPNPSLRCFVQVMEILDDGDEINVITGSRPCKV